MCRRFMASLVATAVLLTAGAAWAGGTVAPTPTTSLDHAKVIEMAKAGTLDDAALRDAIVSGALNKALAVQLVRSGQLDSARVQAALEAARSIKPDPTAGQLTLSPDAPAVSAGNGAVTFGDLTPEETKLAVEQQVQENLRQQKLASQPTRLGLVRQDAAGGDSLRSDGDSSGMRRLGADSGGLDRTAPRGVDPNDTCGSATTVGIPSLTAGNTSGNAAEVAPTCGGVAANGSASLWYKVVGDGTTLTASTCQNGGSGFDTRIRVFSGTCATLTCVGGNDDDPVCGVDFTSTVTWCSSSGTDYFILIDGFSAGDAGAFDLSVEGGATCGLTPNDTCPGATVVGIPSVTAGSTVGAASEPAGACGGQFDNGSASLWYSVIGNGNTLTASTCPGDGGSATFDTRLRVFDGSCAALNCITGVDDSCGLQSRVVWCSELGTQYWILVDAFGAAQTGSFNLAILDGAACAPAANDDCSSAIAVAVPSLTSGETLSASTDPTAPACAGEVNNGSPGVWYSVIGTGNLITASTCENGGDADYDTQMRVYSGTCASLSCVGANDDDPTCGIDFTSTVTWCSDPGVEYFILIDGFSAAEAGNFDLSVSSPGPCAVNDNCDGATTVGINTVTPGTTIGASSDGSATCGVDGVGAQNGVWYKVVGDGTTLLASTCSASSNGDADFDTVIRVFCGTCDDMFCASANDDDPACGIGFQSTATWCSAPGTEYFIQVSGFANAEGNFDLAVESNGIACSTPPVCAPCIPCAPGATPENEPNCGMPDIVNGGCNAPVGSPPTFPFFTDVNCGDQICGTVASTGFFRDTDWYELVVTDPVRVEWCATPDFPALIGMIESTDPGSGDCADTTGFVNPFVFTTFPCQVGCVTVDLTEPGQYWFFVAPLFGPVIPCGTEYGVAVNCSPLGACCYLEEFDCQITSEADCAATGGTFGGNNSPCSVCQELFECGGACDACDIAALVDLYLPGNSRNDQGDPCYGHEPPAVPSAGCCEAVRAILSVVPAGSSTVAQDNPCSTP